VVFFGVEERVAVEIDHPVCDATVAEPFRYSFRYADDDLGDELVCITQSLEEGE
jgi:hypothetical protein